jgi:hypothetical protein
MENYITYHKIINLLQQAQQQSPRLQSFGHGDIVYFSETMSGTTATYPYLFVTPLGITYDESTTTYQCSLIFADIVNTELSNEIDVVSDMSLEARNLLSQIKRGFLDDKIDLSLPSTASPFFERMNDHVGGVVLDCSFIVFEDINACEQYPTTTSVYSQVLSFSGTPNYNSIQYRCDGSTVEACYSVENQNNMIDLVALFNSAPPDPLPVNCDNPTFCYCWTDYGIYYDNGDGRVRLEMPTQLYNTLCPNGTLTLNVIND